MRQALARTRCGPATARVVGDMPRGQSLYNTLGITDMSQSITLNLPSDLADSEWAKLTAVYESMDDWVPEQAVP